MPDITLTKGSTYRDVLRVASDACGFVRVASVDTSAPLRLTVPDHGLLDEWAVQVEGWREFDPAVHYKINVVDKDTIEIGCINALSFRQPVKPVVLRYHPPVDMSGCRARMQVRERFDSEDVLLEITTENLATGSHILIDPALCRVSRQITAADTAALAFRRAVFDCELVFPDSTVTKIDSGRVTLNDEVTR